jgi:hemolysin-activating ACP:hemolysin acyltransferase
MQPNSALHHCNPNATVPEDQRQLWVVEVIAPFGGAEALVQELKAKVFPAREVRFVKVGPEGKSVGLM